MYDKWWIKTLGNGSNCEYKFLELRAVEIRMNEWCVQLELSELNTHTQRNYLDATHAKEHKQ